jgi:hypothetical protein
MAAGGVGPGHHQAPNNGVSNGGAGTAAATPVHGSAASTGDGYDSDGYSFAPP